MADFFKELAKARREILREERKTAGLCTNCGKTNTSMYTFTCNDCTAKKNAGGKIGRPVITNKKTANRHQYQKEFYAKQKSDRLATGNCTYCGYTNDRVGIFQYCSICAKEISDKKYGKDKTKLYAWKANYNRTNTNDKLASRLRSRMWSALQSQGGTKERSSVKELGCTIEQLKFYLESKFTDGMNWGNQGMWHIDHCRPLSSFDLTDPEEYAKACHYTNLQPLWAKDNLEKGAKYETA